MVFIDDKFFKTVFYHIDFIRNKRVQFRSVHTVIVRISAHPRTRGRLFEKGNYKIMFLKEGCLFERGDCSSDYGINPNCLPPGM